MKDYFIFVSLVGAHTVGILSGKYFGDPSWLFATIYSIIVIVIISVLSEKIYKNK